MKIAKSVNRIVSAPRGHILNGRVLNCTLERTMFHPQYYRAGGPINQSVDLEPEMIPVRDQGQEGSCTSFGHGSNADWRQLQARKGEPGSKKNMIFHPEEFDSAACNFFYGQERLIDGDFSQDGGSYVKTGAQVATQVGFVSERVFPYGETSLYEMPTTQHKVWAAQHRLSTALPINLSDVNAIMAALSSRDPVVFGWVVYSSIQMVGRDGIIPMPSGWNDRPEGGHCTTVFGYKTINGQLYFKIRNSWGAEWGANGYAYMPAAYIANPRLASDGWVVK